MSDDLHTPTTAGPEPSDIAPAEPAAPEAIVAEPVAPAAPEPTPVVTEADATASHPVGTAAYPMPDGATAPSSPAQKPELQAAGAFAGGLVLAILLKRLGR